jgi:ERCC4-type nuclease
MFWLDNRESDLIRMAESQTPAPFDVKQLPVGDIWIGMTPEGNISENGLVAERKSIRDLEASILDGRYREQRGRILAFCHENKTQPLYILEGSLSSLTGRLQKKTLLKFINRLVFRYQIPVIQTAHTGETFEAITALVEQWQEDPTALQRTTELVKVSDGIHIHKKSNAAEPIQFTISTLAQCPGVSVKMAEHIVAALGGLKEIMAAAPEDIENVKVGTRRVGPAVAKRLHELLNPPSTTI